MANGWGGARPGAGRKRQETVKMQGNRRDALLDVVTEKLWRETVKDWFATAKEQKNYGLLFPLLPYIMGAAKQEIEVSGQIEHVQMEAARTVLRVIGGTDKRTA
jgi:hypothetical protein